MEIISWGSGRIGDSDKDGNFELEMKDLKLFGFFDVPDVKLEVPTALIGAAIMRLAESAGQAKVPWAFSVGRIIGKIR